MIPSISSAGTALVFLSVLLLVGAMSLIVSLFQSVRAVNRAEAAPDETEWKID